MHHYIDSITHTTAFVTTVVEHWLERETVQGSIRRPMSERFITDHGAPIKLFLVLASAPRLLLQMSWYVLSCLWDGTYIKVVHVAAAGFLSRYLSGWIDRLADARLMCSGIEIALTVQRYGS